MKSIIERKREDVLNWLNQQIDFKRNSIVRLSKDFTLRNVECCGDDDIHIKPIRQIAELLGFEVLEKPFELQGSKNRKYIYFQYNGWIFFELEE